MAVKGKREGRRKHRATRMKLDLRHELARKYVQNKINRDQLERDAGSALEGVMKMVAQLQQEAGKRRTPLQHVAPATISPAVQEALKGMDARMASREEARQRRIQEQRKPPPPPPKNKRRFGRGGPRPGGPRPEGMGPRPEGMGPRPEGMPPRPEGAPRPDMGPRPVGTPSAEAMPRPAAPPPAGPQA